LIGTCSIALGVKAPPIILVTTLLAFSLANKGDAKGYSICTGLAFWVFYRNFLDPLPGVEDFGPSTDCQILRSDNPHAT
tara:strand:+ start:288 stop:524 length:237 start_codon:yes stop_codon:yes gene_type:complete